MKTQPLRRTNGFTLVELLVVITIIAVLAGAATPMALSAIQKAKKTRALNTCVGIASAVNSYYTEYGAMPKDGMSADTTVDTKTDIDFLNVLLGTETVDAPLNTRAIKFLSVEEGKKQGTTGGIDGLVYNKEDGKLEGLFDPWGGRYFVMLDGDYDEEIKVQPAAADETKTLRGRRVAVWSNGADAVSGTGGKVADDVKTWK
jgi:prepilin-type N-terminal cleavage/methylation domain-containing protein